MNGSPPPDRAGDALRVSVLVLLGLAPPAFGATQKEVFTPLLVLFSLIGAWSWARGHLGRALGAEVPPVPARGLLAALHALVLIQLVPLPPGLLKVVSPGSFSFYNDLLLVPLTAWRPITVSPGDTVRGLGFLFGLSLLYGAVFREFGAPRWRRRLAGTVVAVGFAITFLGLFQEAASKPPKMYGVWAVANDWAVFGPYANRNHFAGYMVMAIPLGMAFAIDALHELGRAWGRRRRGWLALGGPEAAAFVRRAAVAMVLVVGLVAAGPRGGFVAFVVSMPALVLAFRRRLRAAVVTAIAVILIAGAGVSWVGLQTIVEGFQTRGLQASRLDLWKDMLPIFSHFPVFGVGFNGFGMAYLRYQTIWRSLYFGYAHNDYLQALLELGVVGAPLVAGLLLALFRGAVRSALRVPFEAGVLGSLVALATHALVDFNWQIPANAATYVALAGLAMRGAERLDPSASRH